MLYSFKATCDLWYLALKIKFSLLNYGLNYTNIFTNKFRNIGISHFLMYLDLIGSTHVVVKQRL